MLFPNYTICTTGQLSNDSENLENDEIQWQVRAFSQAHPDREASERNISNLLGEVQFLLILHEGEEWYKHSIGQHLWRESQDYSRYLEQTHLDLSYFVGGKYGGHLRRTLGAYYLFEQVLHVLDFSVEFNGTHK